MIEGLKAYPVMKDSGVEWLGEVPVDWIVTRMKTVFRERSEKGFPEEPLLAATQTKGVVRKDQYENRTVVAQNDLHLLKLVRVGDFVISLRSFQGGIEYAREQGIISPAYTILFPINLQNHGYFSWLFKSTPFVDNLSLFVTGIREGQNIDYEKLSRGPLPLPPLPEQTAIVRFLEHADARIHHAVQAKRRLIALLDEEKQAVIHRAVTRGLEPDVPLKPSGVEWLGDVPAHWDRVRLGRLIRLITGFPFKSEGFTQAEEDIRLLRGINISPARIRWDSVVRWPLAEFEDFSDFELLPGDIVLGMDRPIISSGIRVASIGFDDVPSLLLQRVARIRNLPELDRNFLLLLLQGKLFKDYLSPIFTGISVPHVSPEQIGAFRFALPPIGEQKAIVQHLAQATANLDEYVTATQREIDLLLEFRTRLIADVVTGKLDVRGVAAGLPETTPGQATLDAFDAPAGDEEDAWPEPDAALEDADGIGA